MLVVPYLAWGLRFCHIEFVTKRIHFLLNLVQHLFELALYVGLKKEVHISSGVQEFLRVFNELFSSSQFQIC